MSTYRTAVAGLIVLLILVSTSCRRPPTPPATSQDAATYRGVLVSNEISLGDSVDRIVTLPQGWSNELARLFYNTSQGSHLLPYDWFLHLEQPGSTELLRDNENMRRLRYIPRMKTSDNPDGLPIGFVKDDKTEPAWMGLTCSACHTAQINYEGTGFLVDGGPAMGHVSALLLSIEGSLDETIKDSEKFQRFAGKVLGEDAGEEAENLLKLRMERMRDIRHDYNANNIAGSDSPHAFGYARVDAFGAILNEVMVKFLHEPDNRQDASAPVSYPFLWDTPQHDFVQWNGVANNKGIGPLGRNTGEVLGVFGDVEIPADRQPLLGYRSTVRTGNLIKLEDWVRELWSPQWPKQLPPIDTAKAKLGRQLYATNCLQCHQDIDRTDPKRKIVAQMDDVGTDSQMYQNFINRGGKTGRLEGKRINFNPVGAKFGPAASGGELLRHVVIGTILGSLKKPPEDPVFEEIVGAAAASARPPAIYKGRPLNGIWATAPYLHNGSVPNLYELLLPAKDRSRVFYVGRREFDPEKVGFVSEKAEGLFEFRTHDDAGKAIPGNSNEGHEYGIQLSKEERMALLEYLKSL